MRCILASHLKNGNTIHSSYLSAPPAPAVVYFIQAGVFFSTEKRFVFGYFVANLRTFWCSITSLNDAFVYQNCFYLVIFDCHCIIQKFCPKSEIDACGKKWITYKKELATFTQLVKVRGGNLVLPFPNIRFSRTQT